VSSNIHPRTFYVGYQGGQTDAPFCFQIIEQKQPRCDVFWSVHYLQRSARQLGAVRAITPGRDDGLLDACIAFYPQHFRHCPALRRVERLVRHTPHLNFRQPDAAEAFEFWPQLREEARPAFDQLRVYEAVLRPVEGPSAARYPAAPWWSAAARVATSLWRAPMRAA